MGVQSGAQASAGERRQASRENKVEGKLKSLHQFIDLTDHPYAVRIYGGEFSVEQHLTPIGKKPYWLMNLPYYLGTKLPAYVAFLVDQYR